MTASPMIITIITMKTKEINQSRQAIIRMILPFIGLHKLFSLNMVMI